MAFFVRTALWLWLFAAYFAGHFFLLQRVPPLAVPAVIGALTALLVGLYLGVPPLRAWLDGIELRTLVFLHVVRFVGVYFLILYRRGELPYEFAVPGGWGEIVVAFLALVVALAPFPDAFRPRAIRIWNLVGLIGSLLLVLSTYRLSQADPLAIRALTYLPLSLLPTFLVPLILATHVVILLRVNRAEADQKAR